MSTVSRLSSAMRLGRMAPTTLSHDEINIDMEKRTINLKGPLFVDLCEGANIQQPMPSKGITGRRMQKKACVWKTDGEPQNLAFRVFTFQKAIKRRKMLMNSNKQDRRKIENSTEKAGTEYPVKKLKPINTANSESQNANHRMLIRSLCDAVISRISCHLGRTGELQLLGALTAHSGSHASWLINIFVFPSLAGSGLV